MLVNLPDEGGSGHGNGKVNRGPTSIPLGRFVDLEAFHEMLVPLVRDRGGAKRNHILQNIALVLKLKKIAKRTALPCTDPRTGRCVA